MSAQEWYYVHGRAQDGPIAERLLRERFEQADLPMDTLVWCDGLPDWVEAKDSSTFHDIKVRPRQQAPTSAVAVKPSPAPPVAPPARAPRERKPASVPPQPATTGASRPRELPPTGYYLAQNGTQKGPFGSDVILRMLANGSARGGDLIWTAGMPTWTPIGTVFGYIPPSSPPVAPAPRMTPAPRISAPRKTVSPNPAEAPGIGRLAYVGISFGSAFVSGALSGSSGEGPNVLALIVVLVASCFAVSQRLRNMGRPPWMTVFVFIPVANFVIGIMCLFTPPNYAYTKQLDGPAKIIIGILIAFVAVIALILLSSL